MHSHLNGHPSLILAAQKLESSKVDSFEIYFEKKKELSIESKDLKIESLSVEDDLGLSIRVLCDQRLGFSFTTALDPESIDRTVKRAIEIAEVMPQDEWVEFASFGETAYPSVNTLDEEGLKESIDTKKDLAIQLERECRQGDSRVSGVRSARWSQIYSEMHLLDSRGEHLYVRDSLYTASIECKSSDGSDSQMGGDFSFSHQMKTLDLKGTSKRAAENACELLNAKSAPSKVCPAIFRNNCAAEMLSFLASSLSYENVSKGRSLLRGRFGEQVFSEKLTIIDDGLLGDGYSTTPFDAEGTPTRRTVLVDSGHLAHWLVDRYYAKKENLKPTGTSVRGVKSLPSIHHSNLFFKAGTQTFEQMIESLSDGILVTELMGLHTANPVTGDFSFGANGILVKNGKQVHPVRGFAIGGNILTLFKKIEGIASDLRFFGSVGSPSLMVREISVGGA